jgi:hypothetical protein
MKPVADFLNNLVFLLIAMGFICGFFIRSCEPIFPSLQGNTILDTELPYIQARSTSPTLIGSIPNQYDYIGEYRRQIRELQKRLDDETTRANNLEIDLREIREQLSIKTTELTKTQVALADSSEALRDMRLDYDLLESNYEEERWAHQETRENLNEAEETIELQYVVINELNQELITVRTKAKRTLIALIVLVSSILIFFNCILATCQKK